MTSGLTVGTWNTHNSFGDTRVSDAMEVVKRLDADVLYLTEFVRKSQNQSERLEQLTENFRDLGYISLSHCEMSCMPFVRSEHTMALMSRVSSRSPEKLSAGTRNSLQVTTFGLNVRGVHLPDYSEPERQDAAVDIVEQLGEDPAIVMGDFNALHVRDRKSLIPHFLEPITNKIEVRDYYDKSNRFQRVLGIGKRICGMADGSTMLIFERAGFRDADPTRTPTVGIKGHPIFQIDRILVNQDLKVEDFTVHQSKRLSDHSPISARIMH